LSALRDFFAREFRIANARLRSSNFWEAILWLVVALLVSGRPILFLWQDCVHDYCNSNSLFRIVGDEYFEILTGLLVILFPLVFRLIFGRQPFEALRMLSARGGPTTLRDINIAIRDQDLDTDVGSALRSTLQRRRKSDEESSIPSATELALRFANASNTLAKNIYSRSGVYLLIGVLVAFSGLGFFYLRSATSLAPATSQSSLVDHVLQLAPNFGILFFIEFIAFFFLRQYRSALDEYRYYEALKRRREENLLLLLLIEEKSPNSDAFVILKNIDLYSTAGKLSNNETTELLEAKKLQKDEIQFLDKLVDILSKLKGG